MKARWVRPLAVGVSLAVHAALFVQVSGLRQPQATPSEHARLAEIRLTMVQPAPSEPAPEKSEPIPDPEPDPERPREAPRKPSPKKIAKPKPVEQAEPQPTPPAVAAASTPDKAVIEDLRRRYIAEVMALIEAHKFYPSSARRRRVEGDVHLRLAIDGDGRPCRVESRGEADILVRAARDSLENTPLPAPPPGLELPVGFDFVIKYRLG